MSTTVTVKEHVAVFPFTSVAVYVFVVTPVANTEPDALPEVRATDSIAQLSLAAGME